MYRPSSFSQLPEVVKNLLIINGLFFLATISLQESNTGIDLVKWFGLHQFQSPDFMPHQLITHFFMHANFWHLFFNMFALWMFGKILENVWGAKRFLTYYMITGIGAAFVHLAVSQYQIFQLANNVPEILELAKQSGIGVFTSVPLMQGKLLEWIKNKPEFTHQSPAVNALQFIRSTPGVLAPLVGQKSDLHVKENLQVLEIPPFSEEEFNSLLKKLTQ